MNTQKQQQPEPKKAKLSVPPVSDIENAEKICSRTGLSVFKKSKLLAQSVSTVKPVQLSEHAPFSSPIEQNHNNKETSSQCSSLLASNAHNTAEQCATRPSNAVSVSKKTKDTVELRKPSNPRAVIVNIVQV